MCSQYAFDLYYDLSSTFPALSFHPLVCCVFVTVVGGIHPTSGYPFVQNSFLAVAKVRSYTYPLVSENIVKLSSDLPFLGSVHKPRRTHFTLPLLRLGSSFHKEHLGNSRMAKGMDGFPIMNIPTLT